MYLLTSNFIRFSAILSATLFAGSCVAMNAHAPEDDPCNTGDCLQRYFCTLSQCNATFDPGTPINQEILDAREACKNGADARLSACDTGAPVPGLTTEWFVFLDDLARCREQYGADGEDPNPTDLENCYAAVTNSFRARIANLGNPNTCSMTDTNTPFDSMPFYSIQALEDAAFQAGQTDGRYPVVANSTVGFTSGVGTLTGSQYDVRQIPCIKRAAVIAIYQAKQGVHVEVEDADMNTSDGTHFEVQIVGTKMIDAVHVDLVCVFFDENSTPVIGEIGLLKIKPSPVPGDWNRDEVLNSQDIVDFLDSYDAQTKRADLNGDNQVTPEDVDVYVNP